MEKALIQTEWIQDELGKQEIGIGLVNWCKTAQPIYIRTPFTCGSASLICQLCCGWSPTHGDLVEFGEAVDIIVDYLVLCTDGRSCMKQKLWMPGCQLNWKEIMWKFCSFAPISSKKEKDFLELFYGSARAYLGFPNK